MYVSIVVVRNITISIFILMENSKNSFLSASQWKPGRSSLLGTNICRYSNSSPAAVPVPKPNKALLAEYRFESIPNIIGTATGPVATPNSVTIILNRFSAFPLLR